MNYHNGTKMIDPHLLFHKVRLTANMHIANFGCGQTGHLVFLPAEMVGKDGLVYAVDILKEHLTEIKKRADVGNHHNVHPIWSDIEKVGATSIPEKTIDIVYMVNTLVNTNDHHSVMAEASRLLKDKGRIAVVDWERKGVPYGPSDERHVNFDQIKIWGRQNNFAIQEDFQMGPFHRGVVLYRHE